MKVNVKGPGSRRRAAPSRPTLWRGALHSLALLSLPPPPRETAVRSHSLQQDSKLAPPSLSSAAQLFTVGQQAHAAESFSHTTAVYTLPELAGQDIPHRRPGQRASSVCRTLPSHTASQDGHSYSLLVQVTPAPVCQSHLMADILIQDEDRTPVDNRSRDITDTNQTTSKKPPNPKKRRHARKHGSLKAK